MKNAITGLTLLATLATGACGYFKGEKAKENDLDLAGTWSSGCAEESQAALKAVERSKRSYQFSAVGDFVHGKEFFLGQSCDKAAFAYETEGTYQALGQADAPADSEKINLTVKRAYITPRSEEAVKFLNTTGLCGKSDWSVGSKSEVTDKECAGFKLVAAGDTYADIYKLESGKLFFGKSGLFMTANDERSTELDTQVAYSKK